MATRKKKPAPDGETSGASSKTTREEPHTRYKNKTQSVTARRLAMLANNYQPIPIKGKAAYLTGWSGIVPTEALIHDWERKGENAGTGILTRTTPAIDIDILDEATANDLEEFTHGFFNGAGRLLRRVGQPPKRALLFRTE